MERKRFVGLLIISLYLIINLLVFNIIYLISLDIIELCTKIVKILFLNLVVILVFYAIEYEKE